MTWMDSGIKYEEIYPVFYCTCTMTIMVRTIEDWRLEYALELQPAHLSLIGQYIKCINIRRCIAQEHVRIYYHPTIIHILGSNSSGERQAAAEGISCRRRRTLDNVIVLPAVVERLSTTNGSWIVSLQRHTMEDLYFFISLSCGVYITSYGTFTLRSGDWCNGRTFLQRHDIPHPPPV